MAERTMSLPRPISLLIGAAVGFLAIVAYLASPLPVPLAHHEFAWLVVGTAVGAFLAFVRATSWVGYAALIAAVACMLVLLVPVRIGAFARRDPLPARPLDAVVVLSSDITRDGALDPVATQRLLSGVQLVRRTGAPLLVTSRITDTVRRRVVTSDADQRGIVAIGVDTSDWRVVGPVFSTRDEAQRTAALLGAPSTREIAVVTSPAHSRRACAVFEGVGFHVVCAPSTERQYSTETPGGVTARLRAFGDYAYERLALVKYRMHGWIR